MGPAVVTANVAVLSNTPENKKMDVERFTIILGIQTSSQVQNNTANDRAIAI